MGIGKGRIKRLVGLLFSSAVLLVVAILSSAMTEEDAPVGVNCPAYQPIPGWGNISWPKNYNIPRLVSPDYTVSFLVTSTVLQSEIPYVHVGFFRVTAELETIVDMIKYRWEEAVVAAACFRVATRYFVWPIPELYPPEGWAIAVMGEDECGTGEGEDDGEYETLRGASTKLRIDPNVSSDCSGGTQEEEECYEFYEWWIDETGYHERYLGTLCVGGDYEI